MVIDSKTMALIRGLFAMDSEGNTSIRLIAHDVPPSELKNAVNTHSSRSLNSLLESSIVLDSEGNPALRVSACSFGCSFEEQRKKVAVVGQAYVKAVHAESLKKHKASPAQEEE